MQTGDFFQAGGAVSATAPYYISRACDDQALNGVLLRHYVSILGPRQIGKTSLLFKIQAALERKAIPSAVIDLSTLQGAGASRNIIAHSFDEQEAMAAWYTQLAAQIYNQFQARRKGSEVYQGKEIPDALSFISFLNHLSIIAGPRAQAIIMLDEAAAVPPYLKDTFFLNLRKLLNERQSFRAEPATRITFVFAGAFYPAALVTDTRVSPFNVSDEIYVPDFQRNEVDKLLEGFAKLGLQIEAKAADEIWNAAEGHPFLTQKICQSLVYCSTKTIKLNHVKAVVDNILSHDAHLQNITQRLDENPALVELICKVLLRQGRIRFVNDAAAQLEMLGVLAQGPGGFAQIRNEIYARRLRAYIDDRAKA